MWWAGSHISTPLAWIMKRQKERKSWDVITQNTAVKRTCRGTFFILLTLIFKRIFNYSLNNLQYDPSRNTLQFLNSPWGVSIPNNPIYPIFISLDTTSWNAIGRIPSRRQLKKHYCNHCKNCKHSVPQPGAMFTIISRACGQPAVLWWIRVGTSCNESGLCPPRSRSPSRVPRNRGVTVQARNIQITVCASQAALRDFVLSSYELQKEKSGIASYKR